MAIRRSVLLAAALLAGGTLATPAQAQRCVDNNAKTPAEAFCLLARGERQGSSCYRCEWTNSCQRSAVSIPCAQGIFVSSNARDIKALQELLQSKNLKVEKNGQLDVSTKDAIKAFQAREGLKVDGRVGPRTLERLTK